jgi:diguanylate cyclase (GGDEF)-like protein
MFMVSNAKVSNGITPDLIRDLTPEQEISARFHLLQALQTSLIPDDLLALFYKHLQPLINISGLGFIPANGSKTIQLGRESLHHCDYKLSMDDGALGNIVFNRSKRFSESELESIEQLLSYLVHPLRNAIHYQAALRLTMLDPLTMVGNRAALDVALHRELQLAERHHHDLSLLMIDVDHFKTINDKYGHVRGDQVLKEIANIIQSVCRSSDVTFRYGGEEFVVILGKTKTCGARIIAERIRNHIANCALEHNGETIHSTVSIGIATHIRDQKDLVKDLFERADKALYKAKAEGRNRVISE